MWTRIRAIGSSESAYWLCSPHSTQSRIHQKPNYLKQKSDLEAKNWEAREIWNDLFTMHDVKILSHKRIDLSWFRKRFTSVSSRRANSWILSLGSVTLNDDNFLLKTKHLNSNSKQKRSWFYILWMIFKESKYYISRLSCTVFIFLDICIEQPRKWK